MKRRLLILTLCAVTTHPAGAQSSGEAASPLPVPTASTTPVSADLRQKHSELSELERQLEQIKKQIDLQKQKQGQGAGSTGFVIATGSAGPANSRTMMRRLVLPERRSAAANHRVVPGESVGPEQTAMVLEDMRIMSRILQKELDPFNLAARQMFDAWSAGRSRIEGLYLDGYGVVFQLEVGFPLLAQGEEKKESRENGGDEVWTEARQEIFQPSRKRYRENDEQKSYDPKKVESLKDTIARTLKHASNIRVLKDNECVVIVVSSRGQANDERMPYGMMTPEGLGYGDVMADAATPPGPSVLTLKATQASVKALAQGQLDADQFRAGLQITLY